MAKRGPKGLNLDLDLIEKLAAIHCTNSEIAATLGCDSSLLSKPNYSAIITKGRERGTISLRRKMWDTAMGGNVTMQIWLSKNLLSFSDKVEQKVQGFKVLVEDYITAEKTNAGTKDKTPT